jgi:hypothetical protein
MLYSPADVTLYHVAAGQPGRTAFCRRNPGTDFRPDSFAIRTARWRSDPLLGVRCLSRASLETPRLKTWPHSWPPHFHVRRLFRRRRVGFA